MTTHENEVLDRFQREYLDFNRISPRRQVDTKNVLLKLGDHAGKEFHECDASDIRSFLSALGQDEGQMITTIGKKLSMIRPFFAWFWEVGGIDAERFMQIEHVSPPKGARAPHLPRPYSKKELQRFRAQLDACWPEATDLQWYRWRRGTTHFRKVQPHIMRIQIEAIVALALYCGLRCQEIYDAEIDDIHHDNAYVVVPKGKGGKFREVPHTRASREAVQRWLELRTELGPDHDRPWLCLAWEEVALKPMRLERFTTLMTSIGHWEQGKWRYGKFKPGGWELHRFRHTCGTEWLRHTKRLEIVQKLLGHARIQQTLGYARLVNDDVLAEVAKAETDFEEAVA